MPRRSEQCWPSTSGEQKYLNKSKARATTRQCSPRGIQSRVSQCNPNWRRLSVKPYVKEQCWPSTSGEQKYLSKSKPRRTTRQCSPRGIQSRVSQYNRNWRRLSVESLVSEQCWPCKGRKRKYLCKRKRKATTRRCCPGGIQSRVTLCNRNWRRLSVIPFVNFLRQFRKGKYDWPLTKLRKEGRKQWCKLSRNRRTRYFEEACRARKRGYRT